RAGEAGDPFSEQPGRAERRHLRQRPTISRARRRRRDANLAAHAALLGPSCPARATRHGGAPAGRDAALARAAWRTPAVVRGGWAGVFAVRSPAPRAADRSGAGAVVGR